MAREITTYPETRDDWRRLIPPLEANAPDLPHMEVPRLQLVDITDQVSGLLTQQSALTASKSGGQLHPPGPVWRSLQPGTAGVRARR